MKNMLQRLFVKYIKKYLKIKTGTNIKMLNIQENIFKLYEKFTMPIKK